MPNLTPFWRVLETRTSRTAVMAEWQRVAGECFPVVQQLLQPTEHLATVYPSSKGGLRVVRHADGSIVGVHEGDWEKRQNLIQEDIVLYRADLSKLRKVVSDALNCVQISRTPINTTSSRIQIGNWEPKKAAAFPVHLLLCRQRSDLRREILGITADGRKPGAILLTPTRANWDDEADALARGRNLLLVPLSEVLDATTGGFVETPAWEEFLQAFCQMVKLTLPGNYQKSKVIPRRAELAAKIEKVKLALVDYIRSAKDYAIASIDAGDGARRMKFLTKTDLANLAGLDPYHITRCFAADPQLDQLYRIANDPEQLIKFKIR